MSIPPATAKIVVRSLCVWIALIGSVGAEDNFDKTLLATLAQQCVKCHGRDKVKGDINLFELKSVAQLQAKPKLIQEMLEAVDAGDMPPQGEPPLDEKLRADLVAALKLLLHKAAQGKASGVNPLSRLNRFQYNHSLRDLFALNADLFHLSEKLMTRHENYLGSKTGKMPDRVHVACHSLDDNGGFKDVPSFPKDLRAEHGFDNQANQLTLSPLLLESFFRLSVSIVESPDFNEKSVGIWNEFFLEPAAGGDTKAVIANRLRPFLEKAFRGPVDDATLNRYVKYAVAKRDGGLPFTDCMKKVAAAAISSPKFLLRPTGAKEDQIALASRLSFFLWGSGPDERLLGLAKRGELSKPNVLDETIDRMLADPKIERFLDTFPTQWMQLENILAAAPDLQKNKYYRVDEKHPASLQMVLEPLLLFDAVFVENRPIIELIAPSFGYQSEFLKRWYTSDLTPPAVEPNSILEFNRSLEQKRRLLEQTLQTTRNQLKAIFEPMRMQLLAEKKKKTNSATALIDLKPYAAWEFNGDLKDAVAGLDLQAHGDVKFQDGAVVLEGAFLQSKPLPIELKAKTMEVWLSLKNVSQRAGGAMTIQDKGNSFDSIVFGERKLAHWISSSENHVRTEEFAGSTPESGSSSERPIHLVMVYDEDGTTTLYRNGTQYGKSYRRGKATFSRDESSVLFGLRHLPAGGNKYLAMRLDRARLYDRALTAAEVAASQRGDATYVSDAELQRVLSPELRVTATQLTATLTETETALKQLPQPTDMKKRTAAVIQQFENEIRNQIRSKAFQRTPASDARYGGVITNAATMTMTSSPKRTMPIAHGAWITEVILNDPPPPPPNNVPPLKEDDSANKNLTIRETFAKHREHADCAGCHARIDPLGFALENFDVTGRWRDKYENNRTVDSSGTFMNKHEFNGVVQFKAMLVQEKERFAKAFTAHLLRFALARDLQPADSLTVDQIIDSTRPEEFRIKAILREVIRSETFSKGD